MCRIALLGVLGMVMGCAAAGPGESAAVGSADSQPERAGSVDPARLPVNTWVEFKPTFAGAPLGGRFVAVGWNKMVYDRREKRALIMDRWKDRVRDLTIYANAVVAINPADGTGEVLKLNNYKRQSAAGGGYRTVAMPEAEKDPTPVDRHPYGCLAYVDHDHSLYLGPGANRTAKHHPRDFWRFDLAAGKWHALDPEGSPDSGKRNLLESVMCYDPASRAIVFHSSRERATYLFDVVKQAWRRPRPKVEPKAGMGAAMTFDSRREVVYLFAGPGSKGTKWNSPGAELWAYAAKQNEWRRLADSPVPARAPALAYDSKHDIVLASISVRGRPNRVLIYHPADDRWTELARRDGAVWPTSSWMCLCYDESRDLFVYKAGNYSDIKWLLFRYAPAKE